MRRLTIILFEIFINVVLSIALLELLGKNLNLTTDQQIVIGALFFLSSMAIWFRYEISKISRDSEEIAKDRATLLRTLSQANLLVGINPNLRSLADNLQILADRYGNNDVFVAWYVRGIEDLQKHLKHTVDSQTFDFDQSMTVERSRILDLLKEGPPSYFWAVAPCESIPHFADPDGTAFLRQVDERMRLGQIASVRRLFIYSEECPFETFETTLLFRLHEQNGYDYRLIRNTDFETVLNNFHDNTMTRDFGVWGENFVWETPEKNILNQMGLICRDKKRIAKYKQLYEEMWELATSFKVEDKQIHEICKGHPIYDFRRLLDARNQSSRVPRTN